MTDKLTQLIDGAISRAVDDLLPHDMPAGTVSRLRVEHVMRNLTQRVAADSRNQTLLSLITVQDVAETLGISAQRVRTIARERGVGWQPRKGVWVFTPEDIERLRPRPGPGRPPKE